MKKVFSIVLTAGLFIAEPLMAYDTQAALPPELSKLGITQEDLKDVGPAVSDEATAGEVDTMQRRWGRRCPWVNV